MDWIPNNKLTPLTRLGLLTLGDLIQHFPRRHEDRVRFDQFPDGPTDRAVCLFGTVIKTSAKRYGGWRKAFEVTLENGEGSALSQRLMCRWFNAHFVQKMIATGQRLVVYGKAKSRGKQLVIDHPEFEIVEHDEEESIHFNRLTPVHPAGEGVTVRALRYWIWRALEVVDWPTLASRIPSLDSTIYSAALRSIHFPESWDGLRAARPRIVLEEFFAVQALIGYRRRQAEAVIGKAKDPDGTLLAALRKNLPFDLTGSQESVIREIRADLALPRPMQRLLQGDVGSGKTLVALAAALTVIESGFQAAIMAPTQILAEQHYLNFRRMLAPLHVRLALHTGAKKKTDALPLFEGEGEPQLIVGTHALLYDQAPFKNLGLVVIDEQHKFGVLQRAQLLARGDAPDLLVMTATPIPRTLTQTLYGDLDVSTLRDKPANRGKIITAVRSEAKLPEIAKFIQEKLSEGRQAYVVYPLIDESEKLIAKAASEEVERWRTNLAPHSVELLHGRIDPEEKEAIMARFRAGETKVLVSTTVIEVGVDVANASLMLIENAERFGLAQIHQLRGRVGRGEHKSYCILVHGKKTEDAAEKLAVLEQTSDGFAIAEADLRLRGPGDLIGTAQTGLPPLRMGDLLRDGDLMTEARRLADQIYERDPGLSAKAHQSLRRYVLAQHAKLFAASG